MNDRRAPSHRVLLVDADLAALRVLSGSLAAHGIASVLATSQEMACELAAHGFDAVISSRRMVEQAASGLGLVDAIALELPAAPPVLVRGDDLASVAVEDLAQVITALPAQTPQPATRRFALSRVRLLSVLALLGGDRATGTLTVHAEPGAGEVRFANGDIVDASYLRLEAEKALQRMAGVEDGTATFIPDETPLIPRMAVPGATVETDLARDLDETRRLREDLERGEPNVLLMGDGSAGDLGSAPPVMAAVATRLKSPGTLSEVLDDVPFVDAAVLRALLDLEMTGRVRRMGEKARAVVAPPERLAEVKALAARLRAQGFKPVARIVFAAAPVRLGELSYAIGGLEDGIVSHDPTPSIPVPVVLGRVRFGDGVEVEIVTLPMVPAYAPLWPLALAGAAIVVRLDDASSALLADVATEAAVQTVHARDLVDDAPLDLTAGCVARMIRAALGQGGAGAI